jgi:hypothetical protein
MKGYALLIGVNEVDTSYYGTDLPIEGVLPNIQRMKNVLISSGNFAETNIEILQGDMTNWSVDIIPKLDSLQSIPESEIPFVVLYFSCHGAKIRFENEKFTHKNFLCFRDKMILENEVREEIAKFPSYFNVFVIIDSCYSEGLDLDYCTEQFIGDPELFQNLYTAKKQELYPIISHYQNLKDIGTEMKYKALTCFIYSVEQDKPGLVGSSEGCPTLFTRYFENLWYKYILNPMNHVPLNYVDFNNLVLKKFMGISYSPVVKIYPSPTYTDNFFSTSVPLLFNEKAVRYNNPVNLVIDLKEGVTNPLSLVKVSWNSTHPDYMASEPSQVWDTIVHSQLEDWLLIKRKIESIDSALLVGVRYVGVIYVSITDTPNFPNDVEKFWSVEYPSSINNGLVIICDSDSQNKIVAHGRTKGRVSNIIGG